MRMATAKKLLLRYHLSLRLVLPALALVALPGGLAPLFGQVRLSPDAQTAADNPLAQLLFKVEDIRIRVENIQVLSQYCKPPREPNKSLPQSEIDLEAEFLQTLLRDFGRIKGSFEAGAKSRLGLSSYGTYPVIDGLRPEPADQNVTDKYWKSARAFFTQVANLLAKKQQQLNDAPERSCAPQSTRTSPNDPQPPADPLAGLTRPVPKEITFPKIPPYFCSELERSRWFLDHFAKEWGEADDNSAEATHYRAVASARATEYASKDAPQSIQRRLDAEEAWADKNFAQQLRLRDLANSYRDAIFHTPIIDCSPKTLAAKIDELRHQIADVDTEIKKTEANINAIEDGIRSDLEKDGLLDAYEQGVLWGVAPVTAEHHNLLQDVAAGQKKQAALKHKRDKLLTQKAGLQDQLQRTVTFADSHRKAGEPCAEEPKTAQLKLTVTPASRPAAEPGDRSAGSSDAPSRIGPKPQSNVFNIRGEFTLPRDGSGSSGRSESDGMVGLTSEGAGFLWMAFGFDPYVIASGSLSQTIPPTLQMDAGPPPARGESVLKYAETAPNPTPPDPRLKQWSDLWVKAEQADGAGDFQQARQLRRQAEELFWTEDDADLPFTAPFHPGQGFHFDNIPLKLGARYRLDFHYAEQDASTEVPEARPEGSGGAAKNPQPAEIEYSLPAPGVSHAIFAWPNGRDAVHACRSAPGRAFDTSAIAPFIKAGVQALTQHLAAAGCQEFLRGAGSLYSEPNPTRNVAAPSLDPVHWPSAAPAPLRIRLSVEGER